MNVLLEIKTVKLFNSSTESVVSSSFSPALLEQHDIHDDDDESLTTHHSAAQHQHNQLQQQSLSQLEKDYSCYLLLSVDGVQQRQRSMEISETNIDSFDPIKLHERFNFTRIQDGSQIHIEYYKDDIFLGIGY